MARRPTVRTIKAKGSAYERELAQHLARRLGIQVERAPLSGGGAIGEMSGGADLLGTPLLHVEAKRCERMAIGDWMRQAEASLAKTHAQEYPCIVTRASRQTTGQSYVVMRLDGFCEIYRAYLALHGYTTKEDQEKDDALLPF